TKKLVPETAVVNVGCNIHGWMKMGVLVVDHPYVAVTGADGSFELKNVKPGDHVVVVRNSNGQFIRRNDLKVTISANEVKDLGEVKWSKEWKAPSAAFKKRAHGCGWASAAECSSPH